ncbi:hypothetical protein B0H67DRAFT_476064 [Lasiosphaeris hirsuta]|uniref:Uncharacterized protein n=1 Tax=Lasiosphaeris hirsuta TaxID=260670 RepID=A0AA40EBA8_9PEZI|nr:hypothetical protein B0H67DRAFT_476064 [Lasiosphaeris hirsuta]
MLKPLLLLLPTLALSSPATPPPAKCTYGAYRCSTAKPSTTIEVCDYSGKWVLDWKCAAGTTCKLLPSGGGMIPYCVAAGDPSTAGGCTTPGKMECMGQGAIKVCNVMGAYEKVGDCPAGTQCKVMYGQPYCV